MKKQLTGCVFHELKGYYFFVGVHAVAQLVGALSLQTGMSRVRFPMFSLRFFIDINNPSGSIKALESSQPLREMSVRNSSLVVKAVGA